MTYYKKKRPRRRWPLVNSSFEAWSEAIARNKTQRRFWLELGFVSLHQWLFDFDNGFHTERTVTTDRA
jgi:hypothetical protein